MTDIEVYEPAPPARQQHSIGELATLADRIARTGMVPAALRGKPDEILAVFLYGTECGLPLMQSLQLIDVIQGRPTLNAQGQRALILSAGHHFKIVDDECTTEMGVVECRRRDEDVPSRVTFTLDDARAQNLLGKDAWKKNPADMLVARATTRAARRHFADVTLGLAYDPEELEPVARGGVNLNDTSPPPELATGPQPLGPERTAKFVAYCTDKGLNAEAVVAATIEGRGIDELTTADVTALRKTADEMAVLAQDVALEVRDDPGVVTSGEEDGTPVVGGSLAGVPSSDGDWEKAKRRFFAVVRARWPEVATADREGHRKAFLQRMYGVDSVKDLTADQLEDCSDTLDVERTAAVAELGQVTLDEVFEG